MSARTVRLLHVEDDRIQQRLVANNLRGLGEVTFAVAYATSEEEALHTFTQEPFDLVLLDYQLSEGNGTSLLREIRRRDPIVPIIALSGMATAAVAADLMSAGADDFISKRDLSRDTLKVSVRTALLRADGLRKRASSHFLTSESKFEARLAEVCQAFVAAAGPNFLPLLNELESMARQAHLTEAGLKQMFHSACAPSAPSSQHQVLRPLFLEMLVRLFGSHSVAK